VDLAGAGWCRIGGGQRRGSGFKAQHLIERVLPGDQAGAAQLVAGGAQIRAGEPEELAEPGVGVIAQALRVGDGAEEQVEGQRVAVTGPALAGAPEGFGDLAQLGGDE